MPAKPEEWGTGKLPFLGQHNTHTKVRQRNHKNRKLHVNLFDKKKISQVLANQVEQENIRHDSAVCEKCSCHQF
jgi:hypothetical protein